MRWGSRKRSPTGRCLKNFKGKYQYYTQADLSRLRAAGYAAPMTSLEDGVRQYVQKYLDREDSYV